LQELNLDVIFAVKLELFDLEVESHARECNILSNKKSRGGHEKGCCSLMCLGLKKGNECRKPPPPKILISISATNLTYIFHNA